MACHCSIECGRACDECDDHNEETVSFQYCCKINAAASNVLLEYVINDNFEQEVELIRDFLAGVAQLSEECGKNLTDKQRKAVDQHVTSDMFEQRHVFADEAKNIQYRDIKKQFKIISVSDFKAVCRNAEKLFGDVKDSRYKSSDAEDGNEEDEDFTKWDWFNEQTCFVATACHEGHKFGTETSGLYFDKVDDEQFNNDCPYVGGYMELYPFY